MKPIEPGTPFEIPLPEGGYAYGYVSYFGYGPGTAECTLHNIYDYRSKEPGQFAQAFKHPLLSRDMLNEASMHSRTKHNLKENTYWPLKRKMRVPDILPPKYDLVTVAGGLRNIWTGEFLHRLATPEELIKYPDWRLPHPLFYPLYILGKMTGRVVVLVGKQKDENGKTIKPEYFALRAPDHLNGLEPFEFHAAADT